MKVYNELIKCDNTAIGLGFFDGVHSGHQALISNLVEYAKNNDLVSVIVTFQKSPAENFLKNVRYITSKYDRNKLIELLGVDILIELDFNDELMNLSHDEYLEKILYENLKPKAIFTGFNHTFGKDKKGTPMFLKAKEKEYDYKYFEVSPIKNDGEVVSSTLIKKYLETGNIKRANDFLSRNFKISGKVIEGNKIGRTIGFPTANIDYPVRMAEIPFGVYSALVNVNGKSYKGVLNYGIKPSIKEENKKPVAEVHILGFNEDIYGEIIEVSLIDMIRKEMKFNSVGDLKKQIEEDVKKC
ncbi:MAG: bifunctional riboflavin kinase/FAD synthetase [Candidatus Gastranaerophilales bacterium]|nr:bifunctional riboflavin kinase/FAD synthetase [Candidatus Gastranaerophilales bacterium]